METKNTSKKVKTLDVFGYKIESNSCKALPYNLYLKRFGEFVNHSGSDYGFALTMNQIQIHELLEEAIKIVMSEEADTNQKWLKIETEEYRVNFKIPSSVEIQ